jgi:hypothetical protein
VVEGVPKGDIQSSLKLVAGPSRIREDLAHSVPGEAQKTLSERSATSLIRLRLITFFWDLKRNFQERDQKNFQRLCDALRVVGLSEEDMDSIFQAGAYPSPSPGCPPWPGRRVRCLRAWCIWEIFPWRKEMKVLQPMPLVQPEIRYN